MNDKMWDVVVAGGGTAGCAAAWASALSGAKTLLIERYGFPGGWATAALVNPYMTHRTSDGKALVSGFFDVLNERLSRYEGGILGNCFSSEWMKYVLQELILESGAEILFHTVIADAKKEDDHIVLSVTTHSGLENINTKRIVDCTGDGDVSVLLGAEYEMGDEDGVAQAVTTMFDVGRVDVIRALDYVKQHPDQFKFPKLMPDADTAGISKYVFAVAGYYDKVNEAKAAGEYQVAGDLIFYVSRPDYGEVTFNTTHVGGLDYTNSFDLTKAEIEGRRQMVNLLQFIRKYIPGFENSTLLRTPVHIGVRETRRIKGTYIFDIKDVSESRKFNDAICRLSYYVDIHKGKSAGYKREDESEKITEPAPGEYYEIPYRCLLPLGIDNILIAGRCVSSTQAGHAAIRIMPACMAMGQAAGAAAALSVKDNVSPGEIDIEKLLAVLRDQRAMV